MNVVDMEKPPSSALSPSVSGTAALTMGTVRRFCSLVSSSFHFAVDQHA